MRKGSLVSLLGRQHSKPSIAHKSLREIHRLGGISLLHLPPAFKASNLLIPTCLAATGNYLVEHGKQPFPSVPHWQWLI